MSWISGVISPDYRIYDLRNDVLPEYAHHVFRSSVYLSLYGVLTRGHTTYDRRISKDDFASLPFAIPSLEEQRAIADYLDRKTAAITALIEKKEHLIALLAEKRDALIHKAIHLAGTRSLRIGTVADRVHRPIGRRDKEVYCPIGLYNRGRGIFHKDPTAGADLGDSDFFWIEDGDLIVSGQFAWEGSIALAGEEDTGCVATHRYPIVRGKPDHLETAYLLAFLKTKTGHFLLNEHSRGAAGRNRPLNAGTLMKETIPIPPLHAQRHICDLVHLEKRLVGAIAQHTERLNEYRQALITAAVTGQIDITKEAA